MEEYPSNSHKSKAEQTNEPIPEKKVQKITSGKIRKKNEVRKFADLFLPDDVTSFKSWVLMDIVVPAVKDAIEDIVHMMLRGEPGRSRKAGNATVSKVSYSGYYDRDRDRRRDVAPRSRNMFDTDEVIISSRGAAVDVLNQMDDSIAEYQVVSVADFYDLVGLPAPYTGNNYGWTDLSSAKIVGVRDGYIIRLPRAVPI